jgi:hypothetical protein
MSFARTLLPALLVASAAAPAHAWEAPTTHAGLTEQAANDCGLHDRLRQQFGAALGLFEPLIIPPADAPSLFEALGRLNPTHGYVPDGRGRQSAGGWLAAGSVIADMPVIAARNHYFDPSTNLGLRVIDPLSLTGLGQRLVAALPPGVLGSVGFGYALGRRRALKHIGRGEAVAAPAWIASADNPLGVPGFHDQYRKAVLAATEGERDRHLASALIAAGAILHVLQDMASPSHVRNDLSAHLEPLSEERDDVGSRFERIAALAFGRLGTPGSGGAIERGSALAFFHADDGRGLADLTHAGYFSAGTLPRPVRVMPGQPAAELAPALVRALRYPQPAPVAAALDLGAARGPHGGRLEAADGTCLARYRLAGERLAWEIDDACALEQVASLLPLASAYSAGLLAFLFRGELALVARGDGVAVSAAGPGFGAGKLTILWDDARGVRKAVVSELATTGGDAGNVLGRARLPAGAARVAALFDGVDAAGQPLLAAGLLELAN